MADLLAWVAEHPVLTVVLVFMASETLIGIARGLGPKAPKCACGESDRG